MRVKDYFQLRWISIESRLLKIVLDFLLGIAYTLGMGYKKRPWSQEERYLLKKHYLKSSTDQLLILLKDRSLSSIYSQVDYLKKRGWSFG